MLTACARRLVRVLLTGQQMPRHVAFIMDGNRRFADQLSLARIDGHRHGYNKMKDIVQWCLELGITCISVYAFSIDNFKRPPDEVASLMELARAKFEELLNDEDAKRWQAELRVIGDLSQAPHAIQAAAGRLMQGSKDQGPTRAIVNICFSYTSTQELQHSLDQVCSGLQQCELLPDDITPDLLRNVMHTRDCPPVDLLVRTSGEQRLSDFLVWQSSHALLHWEQCLWPEFGYAQLLRALLAWQQAAPQLAALRAAAADAIAEQQQQAAGNGAASPPPCAWAAAAGMGQQDYVMQQDQLLQQSSLLLQRLQQEQQLQQQQQQQWWGSWFTGSSNNPSRSASSGANGGSGSGSSSPSKAGQQSASVLQQQQQSPVGRSPERASSMSLSMISEEEAICCPHPSQQLRVDSYLRRVEREHASSVQLLAAS